MKCAERIEELRESVLKPTGQKDKRAELHSLKKNRSELPPSERSPITGGKTRTEKMSNVSPRSSAPSSWGNLCACSQTCTQISAGSRRESSLAKKKPIPRCAERAFSVSLLSSRRSGLSAKLSLEANESAKSPSPSLAGQSVIVNQAGLLAPVHRSSASSRGFLPSDC